MARAASFLILTFVFTQAHFGFNATNSNGTTEQAVATMMPMVAPLFVEDQNFESTLIIVNAAKSAEYVDVSVRGLNGGVISSRRVDIAPHDQTRIEIADFLKTSGSLTTTGSVVVMAAPGSGSAVAAALSITHRATPELPELNYIDEELLMVNMNSSAVLQGVGDSGLGSPLIALASVIDTVQHVRVDCFNNDGRDISKTVDLWPGETLVTEACSARTDHGMDFEAVSNRGNDLPSGPVGIALKSDAMAGSFVAFGLISHEKGNARFFSTIAFADPKSVMSSTTVFVGVPVGQSALLSAGNYVPQVSVSNFGINDVQMRVQYAESSDGGANVRDLVTIDVPAMSSKEVLLSDLDGDPELTNSFLVTSNAPPGQLVSKLVAKDYEQPREIELLGKDAMDPQNGGNHPWSLQNGTQSMLLLFNNDQQTQLFSIAIAGAATIWSKTYKLQPMQTEMINIATLARSHARDDQGSVFPANLLSGDVSWFTAGGMGRGRVLQADATKGMARSFSCGIFATPCSPATLDVIQSPLSKGYSSSADFSYQICGAPDQFSCTGPPASGSNDFPVTWTTENSSIASAGGGGAIGTVTGEGAGTTEIIATAENNFGTCSVGAGADVTVVAPDHVTVLIDQQGYPKACPNTGIYVRQMEMQVVDSSGKAIPTDAYIQESFSNETANSCGNGSPIPAACSLTGNTGVGQFLDTMAVSKNFCGSGINPGSGCGLSLTSTWNACSTSGNNQLWSSPRVTHSNGVEVNGSWAGFVRGTPFH